MRIIVNFLAFQAGWFACILGVAYNIYWLGPILVAAVFGLHLYLTGNYRREILIGLLFVAAGFVIDTQFAFFGVYTPFWHILPPPFSSPWLLAMWLNLATVFNVSLRWLHKRYRLAALLGGIGGPLAYYGGVPFGALTFHQPLIFNLMVTAAVWAAVTPLLFFAVAKINEKFTVEQ